MLSFLKLVKFDHLILIALAQLSVKYGLLEPFGIDITLNSLGIALLIIASVTIAAAGNIIIEIYDLPIDSKVSIVNGSITEKSANRLFMVLNVTGVLIGFYLANMVGKPIFAALFIIVSGLFYIYATYLKEIFILKNIIIGVLGALVLLIVGIFDLIPAITDKNRESQAVIFSIIFDYAVFAFMIIVLRELIKDCIRIDQDHNAGLKTVPITLGKDRTIKLIAILSILPIAAVVYYIYTYLFSNTNAVIVVLFLIIAPLLFFTIKVYSAQKNKHLKQLLLLLKVLLLLATGTLFFYQFLLK